MITEDYVSFETAQLLKEKGFNEECFALYNPDGMLIQSGIRLNNIQVDRVKGSYSAPTLQMAMKWLREEKHLQISVSSYSNQWEEYIHGWQFLIKKLTFTEGLGWNWDDSFGAIINKNMSDDVTYKTYEEACEAGIKHCLENLI